MLQALSAWLHGIPLPALYALVGLSAFIEGVVPPVPGDAAVAFVAFLAARGGGAWVPTALIVTLGSVAGSAVVWWLGRRLGAEWMTHQLGRLGFRRTEEQAHAAEERVERAYARYGWVALFVSRFVPGVRAMVPAAAGALRIPFWEVVVIFSAASLLWYGTIVWVAFKVGSDWESVRQALATLGRDVSIGAVAIAVVLVLVGWRLWNRRRERRA